MSVVSDFIEQRRKKVAHWIEHSKEEAEAEYEKLRVSLPQPTIFLKDIVGQENAKLMLQIAANRANEKRLALRHILLTGPAGTGKTTLSLAVANEVGGTIHNCLGVELADSAKFDAMMRFIKGDQPSRIVFVDEIHNVPKKIQEYLYTPMQDFRINGQEISPFTVIGATTDESKLLRPMRDRFTYSISVEMYSDEDLVKMIQLRFPMYNVDVAAFIAHRSKGVARLALEHCKVIQDVSESENEDEPSMDHANFAMMVRSINPDGFNAIDLRILIALANAGKPMAKGTIASVVDVSTDDLEILHEPFMIKRGLIVKTSRGRELTDKGMAYLQANVESTLAIGVKEILEVANG